MENTLEVFNEKDKKIKIEVLKYFTLKTNQKDYIIYKNLNLKNTTDTLVFAAEIQENDDYISLQSIEDKVILEKIKKIMEELYNE